jgi:hypothetical protein
LAKKCIFKIKILPACAKFYRNINQFSRKFKAEIWKKAEKLQKRQKVAKNAKIGKNADSRQNTPKLATNVLKVIITLSPVLVLSCPRLHSALPLQQGDQRNKAGALR